MSRQTSASVITILRVRCRQGSVLRHILPTPGTDFAALGGNWITPLRPVPGHIGAEPKRPVDRDRDGVPCCGIIRIIQHRFSRRATMRIGIYARYSSDKQRVQSIEDQLRLCEERAAREGWKV